MLDSDIKTLIRSLVQVTRNSTSATALVQDVISEKGGGLVRSISPFSFSALVFVAQTEVCRSRYFMALRVQEKH